jgi:hypothetical protein
MSGADLEIGFVLLSIKIVLASTRYEFILLTVVSIGSPVTVA